MKRIIFTKHAEEVLEVRHIDREMVTSTLMQPDRTSKAREGACAYLKDFGANSMKVIVSEEKNALVVITCYWVAKLRTKQ